MARTIDASFTSEASVEQVGNTFGQRTYWLDRIAAFGGGIVLDTFDRADDGSVTVTTSQDLRRDALPGVLGKLYPADLTIHRYERWRPTGPREFAGDIDVRAVGAPLTGSGTAFLAAEGVGSRLTFAGTVAFKLPVVGGRIEGYLATQMRQAIADLNSFTAAWIADNPQSRSAT
ncbi:DUF2505 domain-containing protein [Mycolicibacterium sediminis]|uniref:DUF2505 domain-containing protein n=1 Tax=Mycolicibacterium sediminis TaxID=1286180 RepID=A0A7I7QS76_9MYCO|nr:DUF2505 domain-containing protein [Mycolicibacterium sediminis]BBY29228.1 hypothetical protein MSEDJ_33240 [Mycolicibacterium sediminis]